jgi:hypothetical protein
MMHYGRVGAVWLANDRTGLIPHTARRTYNQAMRIQVLMFLAIINLVACATARTPVTAVAPQPTAAVTAMRAELAPKVSRFLMEIAALEPALFNAGLPEVPATERGLLPGWNDSVCPQVTGLPQPEGVFILGRITQVARAADVTMGGAQCSPNLFIFVTTQPKELLQGMQEQQFAEMYGRSALPTVLDQFIATPRTVRVWYNIGVGGCPDALQVRIYQGPGGCGPDATDGRIARTIGRLHRGGGSGGNQSGCPGRRRPDHSEVVRRRTAGRAARPERLGSCLPEEPVFDRNVAGKVEVEVG